MIRIMVLCLACLFAFNTYAFSINYADDSPIKIIPLKNAKIKLMVYYNGNPRGYTDITTDENQKFSLDDYKDSKAVAIEVISIADQDKYDAHCTNTPGTGNKEDILITCKEIKKS